MTQRPPHVLRRRHVAEPPPGPGDSGEVNAVIRNAEALQKVLREAGIGLTAAELAERLQMGRNTVNHALKLALGARLIQSDHARPASRYKAV